MDILDLFFPKKCVVCKKIGSFLCPDCFSYLSFETSNNASNLHLNNKDLDDYYFVLRKNQTTKKIINCFRKKPYVFSLKKVLGELFFEGLIQNEKFIKQVDNRAWKIIPIPLSKKVLNKRGYNQSELLAKELGKKFNLPVLSVLNVLKDEIILQKEKKIKNKNILLIDDFLKTGNTLKNAAKVLKENGAKKVIGLTLTRY
jgi:competence protein ComFC